MPPSWVQDPVWARSSNTAKQLESSGVRETLDPRRPRVLLHTPQHPELPPTETCPNVSSAWGTL